jgi:hypothetical protein
MQQEQPFIERYDDLKNVLRNLTLSNEPPSIYELERLFHSCREEAGVIRETVEQLRVSQWHINAVSSTSICMHINENIIFLFIVFKN